MTTSQRRRLAARIAERLFTTTPGNRVEMLRGEDANGFPVSWTQKGFAVWLAEVLAEAEGPALRAARLILSNRQ